MNNENSIWFADEQFRNQNKEVAWLCQAIKSNGYAFMEVDAPDNSIEWLNQILDMPGLFDLITASRSPFRLTSETERLKNQTADYRQGTVKSSDVQIRNAIRRLNRLALEAAYPKETPRCGYRLTALISSNRGSLFLQEYPDRDTFRQDMKTRRPDIQWGLLVLCDKGKVISDYFSDAGDRDKIGLTDPEPKSVHITPEGLNPRQAALREAAIKHFKSNKAKAYISGQLKHINSSTQLAEAIKFLFDEKGNPPALAPLEDIIEEREKTESKIRWLEAICAELKNTLTTLKEMEDSALALLSTTE